MASVLGVSLYSHGSPQESSVWATLLHMEVGGQPGFPHGCIFPKGPFLRSHGWLTTCYLQFPRAERLEHEADNPVITFIKAPEIRGASWDVAR